MSKRVSGEEEEVSSSESSDDEVEAPPSSKVDGGPSQTSLVGGSNSMATVVAGPSMESIAASDVSGGASATSVASELGPSQDGDASNTSIGSGVGGQGPSSGGGDYVEGLLDTTPPADSSHDGGEGSTAKADGSGGGGNSGIIPATVNQKRFRDRLANMCGQVQGRSAKLYGNAVRLVQEATAISDKNRAIIQDAHHNMQLTAANLDSLSSRLAQSQHIKVNTFPPPPPTKPDESALSL